MNKRFAYLILILSFFSSGLYSQLSHGGKPYPYTPKSGPKPVIMPAFDMQTEIDKSLSEDAVSGKKPFIFAKDYTLDLNPENSGLWTQMPDGTKLWRLHLVSSTSYGVSVLFSKYFLKNGAYLFLYPPSQSSFLGGYNEKNNNPSHSLPTPFIEGEEIIIELQVPPGISDYGELQLGSMAHAFIDLFGSKKSSLKPNGVCSPDINCQEGNDWQLVKKAVCHISIKVGSSTITCTGALINNTAQDTVPYVLTANHCISSAYQAGTAIFKFDYELDTCAKTVISGQYSLAGSDLLATSADIDFTLLRLYESPPAEYKPYFAGWSVSENPATNSVCIQHPYGGVKKISIDNDPLTAEYQNPIPSNLSWLYIGSLPQAFWRVQEWDIGTTEGGSSGSPLFNQNKLIVGNLTGGQSECAKGIFVNDYFSKFSMGWDYYTDSTKQLKAWLDPLNSGSINLLGFNPFGEPDTSLVDTTEYSSRFNVFPNPATGMVTFETDSLDISGGTLSILSLNGKKIAVFTIRDEKRLSFSVDFLPQGVYILELDKGSLTQRKRLLVINPVR
ncbi:MAG: trypsin-like peptidase domain-containing protein [Bacteroidales bacterium]|nr:trypsin-like peptidase domain-containing protein [Bacteroidales bacterium]MCB9013610.1 trypsin-like peptidase domain-containing protein [Bacteroidales bacterium]